MAPNKFTPVNPAFASRFQSLPFLGRVTEFRRLAHSFMWTCDKCGEQHEDGFNSCWKCAGTPDAPVSTSPPPADPLRCPRCPTTLDFVGTKKFHEGTRWGLMGELGELFVNRESFDIYVCPRCGRVEFFIDGIGEDFRPR